MHLILASNSPRRKQLLAGLDIPFEVKVLPGIEENYPQDLPVNQVAGFIAKLKAEPYQSVIDDDTVVLTADTVVISENRIFGKPANEAEAEEMLLALSGKTHQVTTGVCLTSRKWQHSFDVTSDVTFKQFTPEEIHYYISHYRPFDKAGAYGIQEWIGYIGVTGLKGSYFNVMGLPVQRIYQELKQLNLIKSKNNLIFNNY